MHPRRKLLTFHPPPCAISIQPHHYFFYLLNVRNLFNSFFCSSETTVGNSSSIEKSSLLLSLENYFWKKFTTTSVITSWSCNHSPSSFWILLLFNLLILPLTTVQKNLVFLSPSLNYFKLVFFLQNSSSLRNWTFHSAWALNNTSLFGPEGDCSNCCSLTLITSSNVAISWKMLLKLSLLHLAKVDLTCFNLWWKW